MQHGPLLFTGGLLLLVGLVMFTGLLGEILMRTYFESQGRRIYAIREVRSQQEADPRAKASQAWVRNGVPGTVIAWRQVDR
ncbi:MAG: hypothetical protein QM757_07615 [Paludibaculum sp.]